MISPTPNRLLQEKSPYLLQHAGNPVDWYPWGDEAFDRAQREDKPVFLSVGYSTCHWCHVMAHESFEDEATAALLNEAFVCVKVDREERPDIDGIYMSVCQMMTGSGGWPLTIIMTPDRLPFFAATYIPKESRWGRQGLVELIPRLKVIWETRRDEVENAAAQTVAHLMQPRTEKGELRPEEILARTFAELQGQFDDEYGGFGNAPKFPMPHQIVFLLRHWQRTGAPDALRMADKTLSAMRQGGIFDQLGYGFHRYSTDRQWLVPHFEKMLYDQALLTMAFTEAFQATGDEAHARTVREVLDYCIRDLRSPEGGFFTAEDADSEGEEGRFYLWRMEEIRRLLGPEEIRLATAAFSLAEEGNFVDPVEPERRGDNILHLSGSPAKIAEGLGMTEAAFLQRLEKVRLRLLAAREKRVRPQRDDKILTDWNGLMIAALARAARVLGEPRYLEAAREAIAFILAQMKTPDGRLLHRFCKGEAAVTANLDDYAFLIWGLIDAYEAGFNADDLREAIALQGIVDRALPRSRRGLLFHAGRRGDASFPAQGGTRRGRPLGKRGDPDEPDTSREDDRGSTPEEEAAELSRAFAGSLQQVPTAHAQWMIALELLAAPSREVVIAGRSGRGGHQKHCWRSSSIPISPT